MANNVIHILGILLQGVNTANSRLDLIKKFAQYKHQTQGGRGVVKGDYWRCSRIYKFTILSSIEIAAIVGNWNCDIKCKDMIIYVF